MDSNRSSLDHSFADVDSLVDMPSVISGGGGQHGDGYIDCNPVKKLSETFESCAKDDCLKVYLRVRPIPRTTESTITVDSENTIITQAPDCSKRAVYTKMESRHYMFSRVFPAASNQGEVFEHTTRPLLNRFLSGENCVLFAYGMTNAGKTHTIQGTSQHPGILPRLVSSILDEMTNKKGVFDWVLQASMLEVYQENIFDLLGKKKSKLTIRDGFGKVDVPKLSVHNVNSIEDAFKLMDTASSNRSKASTFLNHGSSRSHAVYTLTLHRPGDNGSEATSVAFQLVDLAGAERGNRTKATVAQQKEANNINTSLMQLWRCLNAIKRKNNDLNGSMEVIPFRESKLTHLLMPILSRAGLAGVSMIACVNPQVDDYDETLSILANASLASKIKEFTDVGRTAGQAALPTSLAPPPPPAPVQVAHPPPPPAGPKMISLEDLKDYKDKHPVPLVKKRSRQESMVGTVPSNAPTGQAKVPRNHRTSNLGAVNHILQNIQNVSASVAATAAPATQAPVQGTKPSYDGPEQVEQLKKEVATLREANRQLMLQSLARETAIREEVSREMAERSQHLLETINKLRKELYDKESANIGDITKSCKKARKDATIERTQRDLTKALDEAEDELERIKMDHEIETARLRAENERLKHEISVLKRMHNLPVNETIQEIVSKGIRKDATTGPNDENSDVNCYSAKPVQQKSPQRSPLSPITKTMENVSPVAEDSDLVQKASQKPLMTSHSYITSAGNNAVKMKPVRDAIKVFGGVQSPTHQATSTASPQRLRGMDNVPYFTRLRSHFAR